MFVLRILMYLLWLYQKSNLKTQVFICSKTDYQGLYDTVLYKEKDWETLPGEILDKIDLS